MSGGSVAAPLAGTCFAVAAIACARRRWAGVGRWTGAAGIALMCGALAARGIRLGYWPLGGEYEFLLSFALATALTSLVVVRDRPRAVRTLTLAGASVLTFYARLLPVYKRTVRPLPPTLHSPWLPLHAGTAAMAYGMFVAAGAAGAVWLARRSTRAPSALAVERTVRVGYPLLTASMALGMVWAQAAWGRYWGWDIKEIWTFVTWLLYTLYMHLPGPRRHSWWGATIALGGLGAMLITMFGTPRLAVYSLHTWAR